MLIFTLDELWQIIMLKYLTSIYKTAYFLIHVHVYSTIYVNMLFICKYVVLMGL
jgi:hypothetical protein